MAKLVTNSKQSVNMSHIEYMQLHRRMFAIVHLNTYRICLNTANNHNDIYVDVTESAFNSFLKYEMDYGVMLNIFASLCVKLGSFPCPF